MSIENLGEKIKLLRETAKERFVGDGTSGRYFTAIIVILVGLSSFGLGRLSAVEEDRQPIIIENRAETAESNSAKTQGASVTSAVKDQTLIPPERADSSVRVGVKNASLAPGGKLVASKNGTKYYFPWCGGASNIAEKNKIWFSSEVEARAKGYQPAANCKGLK